jgi:hypothetical protein
MFKFKTKSLALVLGVLVMSFLVGYLVFAWTSPNQAPPDCTPGDPGCDAPLNVSITSQIKPGRLDFQVFYDYDDPARGWYIDPFNSVTAGLFRGKVGIGTTGPLLKLDTRGANAKTSTVFENIFQVASTDLSPLALRIGIQTNGATPTNRFGSIEVDDAGTKRNLILQPFGGNIGIGRTNPDPVAKLDIYNTTSTQGLLVSTILNVGDIYGIKSSVDGPIGNKYALHGSAGSAANGGTNYALYGSATGTGTNWGLYIASGNAYFNGNVGIGTTGPNQKLSVAGTLGILEGGASPSFYTIFQGGDQSANLTYTLPINSANGCLTNSSGTLSWGACGGGAGYWAPSGTDIYNNNTGNVGIGTTSPRVTKLDISNTTAIRGLWVSTSYSAITNYGIIGDATGGTSNNRAAQFSASGGSALNVGLTFSASGPDTSTNYGVWGSASGGIINYGLRASASGPAGSTNFGLYVDAGNAYIAGNAEIAGSLTIGSLVKDYCYIEKDISDPAIPNSDSCITLCQSCCINGIVTDCHLEQWHWIFAGTGSCTGTLAWEAHDSHVQIVDFVPASRNDTCFAVGDIWPWQEVKRFILGLCICP